MRHMRFAVFMSIAAAGLTLLTACPKGPTPEELAAAAAEVDRKAAEQASAAEARIRQGLLYANQGDYPNAINEFSAAIEIRPSAKAYSNLGAAYMQIGKRNLAFDALKNAEKLSPEDALVLYNLTAYYSVTGNTDIAAIYLDKALTHGFANYDALRFDPDLENLRGEPDFRAVLERHKVFIQ